MTSSAPQQTAFTFGSFLLDVPAGRLSRDGVPVALRPKAFDLLVTLVRRPGVLVTKNELLDAVWGRRHITEGVIKSVVAELRTTLHEDAGGPQWIETVPRRGYRFAPDGPPDAQASASGAAPAPAPAQADASARGNVPYPASSLLAREDALASLRRAVAQHRLVTVAGPSGVGKTRVALAFAHGQRACWSDGVWLVELAALSAASTGIEAVSALIAQTLQLDGGPAGDIGTLARSMRALDALLVLDNAEHVLEPVAQAVAAMLAASPSLKIVVTSQEALRIDGEWLQRLPPLGLPAVTDDDDSERLMSSGAVQLFVERTSSRLQGFTLAPEQQQAVAAICRALDGMPLALELAAARVPMLGVHGVADMLGGSGTEAGNGAGSGAGGDARFRLLSGGARFAAPRQQTLHNAIAWSHGLLNDVQQRVFRRLGVFAGSFTPRMARRVCAETPAEEWMVFEALAALTDKSLVEALPHATTPRLRLLESPRAFALQQLQRCGDRDATLDRHLDNIVAQVQDADARALRDPGLAWIKVHLPDLDNLRAALRWAQAGCRTVELVELVAHSAMLWCRAGLAAEGRSWCDAARVQLQHARETPPPTALQARDASAGLDLATAALALYGNSHDAPQASLMADRAADALAAADPVRAYFALYLGFQLRVRAQLDFDRVQVLQRMRSLEQADWGDLLTRFLRSAHGYHLRLSGDAEGYLHYCRTELALCSRLRADAEQWTAAQGLMLAESDSGRPRAAIDAAAVALRAIRAAGRIRQYPVFVALWTTMLAEFGADGVPSDPQPGAAMEAITHAVQEAWAVVRGTGNAWMLHVALAWLACRSGRAADAARLLGWHQAALGVGRALAPGGYIGRSTRVLEARLAAELGQRGLDQGRAEGQALDEEAACRLALAGAATA